MKTAGVHINDVSSFVERETGRVDLDSVNPSGYLLRRVFPRTALSSVGQAGVRYRRQPVLLG